MKFGFLGLGGIASHNAKTLSHVPGAERWAVGSRDLEKAQAFARDYGFARAYGSYEELVADPEVEIIYVATPHFFHFDHAMLALEHGKHVFLEKAFTINADQAKALRDYAAEHNLFLAEAIWPRYMPSRKILRDIVEGGIIGKVYTLTASLSAVIDTIPRIYDPYLGGGALLDVGVYGITFAMNCFGSNVVKVTSSMIPMPTGVDGTNSIILEFAEGRMAVLTHGVYGKADKRSVIYGDQGYAVVDDLQNPHNITIYDICENPVKTIAVPEQINGYEYEFIEIIDSLSQGKTETPSMPVAETVKVMEIMDACRKQWGLRYPGEN